jgi:hypothetical protein
MVCTQVPSLTNYLNLVKPFVSDRLIDADGWADIEAIAQYLPSQLTNFFGFECRLGVEAAKADFLLCIGAGDRGQDLLTGREPNDAFPDRLFEQPVWDQIRNFVTCWHDQTSTLHQHVNNIWLEFDVTGNLAQLPVPSCFFGSKSIRNDVSPGHSDAASDAHTWVSRTAIRLLKGRSIPPGVERQLFRCLHALPDGAHVFQVGLMLARNSDQLRLCLRDISPVQIGDYLSQVGWSGSICNLQSLLQNLSNFVERIDLDLDVDETGVAPKIGLECYLSVQPKFEPRWSSFLNYLVGLSLCLPQKQEALLAYPGFVREKTHREQFPSDLLKLSQFLGSGHEIVFMRGLHHIKVVYQGDRPLEAKAYCWVTHRLLGKSMFYPTASSEINHPII